MRQIARFLSRFGAKEAGFYLLTKISMSKKGKKQSTHTERLSSDTDDQKVKLKAKENWQLRDQFVKAGEVISVEKDYADLLLKQTRNFILI